MIRFTRSTPGRPPRTAGLEVDDDGVVVAWQSAGSRVGRFGRILTPDELDALGHAVTAAAGTPSPGSSGRGASEQVNADDVGLSLDAGADPPPAAAALVGLLRTLHADLLEHPLAALELDVAGEPATAVLRHLGDEPVAVDTSRGSVRASTFDADSAIVDQVTVDLSAEPTDAVGPGWEQPVGGLVLAPLAEGQWRTVKVDGVAADVDGTGSVRAAELVWMEGDDE